VARPEGFEPPTLCLEGRGNPFFNPRSFRSVSRKHRFQALTALSVNVRGCAGLLVGSLQKSLQSPQTYGRAYSGNFEKDEAKKMTIPADPITAWDTVPVWWHSFLAENQLSPDFIPDAAAQTPDFIPDEQPQTAAPQAWDAEGNPVPASGETRTPAQESLQSIPAKSEQPKI
jgi:hypothetical protein